MKKKKRDNTFLAQDKNGTQCRHVEVLIEEEEPTKSVVCCAECPNGGWQETHIVKKNLKNYKEYTVKKICQCNSMNMDISPRKVLNPEEIASWCPYRTLNISDLI